MINVSSAYFASTDYNKNIDEIKIMGVYEYHRDLFNAIHMANTLKEANEIFDRYVYELFELKDGRNKKIGNLYKILMGWMFDSNRYEGALLKRWVESRFGIVPNFHKNKICSLESESYIEYLSECMSSKVNKNAMFLQLDLLYHYTQTIIKRFYPHFIPYITLYRGIDSLDESFDLTKIDNKLFIATHNNINSFTLDSTIAEQFGSTIIKVDVPFTKVIFFSDAVPLHHFSGEQEFVVIGGDYITNIV
ncbi:MAG: NAD(+)--dinitrogen-reductase ADP-D-ribosyltransferase [Deferribacterota bacterium]|nr:NAD(+)--dinitrogen-reductase ADP-D-ribosyltransferase [Deferribacterota bacterium]